MSARDLYGTQMFNVIAKRRISAEAISTMGQKIASLENRSGLVVEQRRLSS
jgi:hypothetical protein